MRKMSTKTYMMVVEGLLFISCLDFRLFESGLFSFDYAESVRNYVINHFLLSPDN
jgi:hypothetical protein